MGRGGKNQGGVRLGEPRVGIGSNGGEKGEGKKCKKNSTAFSRVVSDHSTYDGSKQLKYG